MRNRFKSIIGWKDFGAGEHYLLVELRRPQLTRIWPDSPHKDKPEGMLRRQTDQVLTRDDIYALITDPVEAADSGFTGEDLKMLTRALEAYPKRRRPVPAPVVESGAATPQLSATA